MRSIEEKLEQYNKTINESENIWQYYVESYKDCVLTISGDMDFSWGHTVELYFHNVSFMSVAHDMHELSLRFASEEECESLKSTLFYVPKCNNVFVFYNTYNFEWSKHYKYYIIATDFNYKIAFTYNYLREGLEEGEIIEESVLHYYAEEIKLCDEIVRKHLRIQNKIYKDTTIRDLVYNIINYQEQHSEKELEEYANWYMEGKLYKHNISENP